MYSAVHRSRGHEATPLELIKTETPFEHAPTRGRFLLYSNQKHSRPRLAPSVADTLLAITNLSLHVNGVVDTLRRDPALCDRYHGAVEDGLHDVPWRGGQSDGIASGGVARGVANVDNSARCYLIVVNCHKSRLEVCMKGRMVSLPV
jgi:hypothetical protein